MTPPLKWTRHTENGSTFYYEPTGRYRILRSEIDDTWDTGALVPYCVQWNREERMADGTWQPVEIHDRLGDAQTAAARQIAKTAS